MKRLKLSTNNHKEIITEACKVLKSGGIIVFPTETCYGLGVDATNPEAVRKLFHYKGRREGKPLSIAVTGEEMASQYVVINDIAKNLYTNYLPGPITVVSKGLQQVAQGVESEYGTLGIRIPDYQLVLDLLSSYGKPITATSANPSFGKKPYSIDALLNDLSDKKREMIDLAIDAGDLPKRKSSTVVDTTLNNLNVLREGAKKFQDATSEKDLILQAETYSPGETSDFGTMVMLKYIDIPLKRPLVLLLKGELGAGKTHFVKGLAKKIKIVDDITSP
ncbi:threonylcarbamoyl-AMP synthase, partial [Candidatus Dojkabacteria bacterium]|nr:threonylcarbamoyl-AMP synthase [Candidatus Dojkabacteria bacterium]